MQPSIERSSWGIAPATTFQPPAEVFHYRLEVSDLAIEVVTYGASLFCVETPDREGNRANIVLALPDLDATLDRLRSHSFGATVGRFANRIGTASFVLDGVTHQLDTNEAPNQLHGGDEGFGRLVWDAEATAGDDWAELKLRLVSPAGDNGFPGTLTAVTTYRIESGILTMTHEATTDAPTVVSLTNHAYWNLAGSGSARGHVIQVEASKMLEVDDGNIPTGEMIDTPGTSYDLGSPRSVAAVVGDLGGLDHCYLLDANEGGPAALLSEQGSGRRMEVFTDQPSIQVYTGNYLGGEFEAFGAVCLETQQLPDAPNKPEFPSTVLRPGEQYVSVTSHHFSVMA